jgi:hypothetical protein
LERLHDPVDETLIAAFYLDLLVRLTKAGISLPNLPQNTDRWRAEVFGRYLNGIDSGLIVPSRSLHDTDAPGPRRRGRSAQRAAEALARGLTIKRGDLTVLGDRLNVDDDALDDAQDLNLLWRGAKRVGFVGDDLGAYLAAKTNDDPHRLLRGVRLVADRADLSKRVDRHMLLALIFWHLRHDGQERVETFDRFLAELTGCHWTRPAVVATAVRIASTCRLTDFDARVAAAVASCIDSLDAQGQPKAHRSHTSEPLRLVRALAEWQAPEAHRQLWQLATNQNIGVEWPAATALATAEGGPETTLRNEIEEVLRKAENQSCPASLSVPKSDLGYKVASLAWILPALRGIDGHAEKQLARVARLCLAESMSPLRGEMSLAQGLKLAIMTGRMARENVADARELLFNRDRRLRFWHARLVLVQALLAYAWNRRDSVAELRKELGALRSNESHPLVRRGIDLAREGLRELTRSSVDDAALAKYIWIHEREAVRWVGQSRREVTQLAADVVLLSNMMYRLRTQEALAADHALIQPGLPRCIWKTSERRNITHGCKCPHGLCRDPQPPAVLATRARFSESFCREQARLVTELGPPTWTKGNLGRYRRAKFLKKFWDDQAKIAQRN